MAFTWVVAFGGTNPGAPRAPRPGWNRRSVRSLFTVNIFRRKEKIVPTQKYYVGKLKVPSVTTVIGSNLGWNKTPLMIWANQEGLQGRNHRDTAKKAADAGTLAHAMVEQEIKGLPPMSLLPYDETLRHQAVNAYMSWGNWRESVDFELIHSELPLVHATWGYGGTLDIMARVSHLRTLVDLKTSNGVYPDHIIQLSAYFELWNHNHPKECIEQVILLQIGKDDTSFNPYCWGADDPVLAHGLNAFGHLLALHPLKQELEIKRAKKKEDK
jgi:hypothetical protein